MMRRILPYIILFLIFLEPSVGQEVVTGLQFNHAVSQRFVKNDASKSLASDTLTLPFFDDFSGRDIFPSSARWSDNYIFINNTYSADQISSGVATFDAIDQTGSLYETATEYGFRADYLTSLPMKLDLPAADSLRLSFFYQAGGLADTPEENDSLVLQFYAPLEGKWYTAWKTFGGKYTKFRLVILRIDDQKFLKKGFRFRFVNYASLSSNLDVPSMIGNCDIWNLDYISLDKYRNDSDTIFRDVAFRYPPRSLLNTHESMPLKQFRQVAFQEMGSTVPLHYRNNDSISRNTTRVIEIRNMYENSLAVQIAPSAQMDDPLTDIDDNKDLIYTFNTLNDDSALFKVKSWLITDIYDPKVNDTVEYYQIFSNYFAFDDGSSEGGYGVNGLGSRNAMVAYRFKSFIEDTVRAISICFNDSYDNSNQRAFDLMVWDDNSGIPGNVLYSQEKVMVQQGESINGFYTYILRKGIGVNDIFYVGWRQRSETFLNAGLDINTPHNGRQFYWINGNWIQSGVTGNIMIRPVMGMPITTGINDILYKSRPLLHFYPNPATDYITIDNEELIASGKAYISFFSLQGKEILKVPLTGRIDISSLHEGMYIIAASRNGNPVGFNRLIKLR